jgi:O-antigen ligase
VSVSLLLLLGYGAVLAVSLFWWFVRLEREGRSSTIVLLILWLLVIESALYENQNKIPNGLFHPGIGADPNPTDESIDNAVSFRLPDLIIPVALGALLYARGLPERIRSSSVWFVPFFTWLLAAALIGLHNGNQAGLIAYELKAIVYLGVFALASTVPFRSYIERPGLYRLIYGSSAIATLLILTDGLQLRFSLDIPIVPLPEVGQLGPDAAGVFVPLGVIALALALFRQERRFRLFGAAGPLLLSPAAADQRAAIGTLVVALVVLMLGMIFTRRRLQATPTEFALVALLGVFLVFLPPVLNLARGAPGARLPFASEVEQTFTSTAKQQSAESRINQWRKVRELIEERPVAGWGLGKTYVHYDAGYKQFFETNYTHNIVTDLIMRTGAIGLILFLLALLLVVLDGVAAWRWHTSDLGAALGLAAVAAISGLLARGMVESLFEKYRLATMLGVFIGFVGSVAVASAKARAAARPVPQQAWSSGTSFAP